MNSTRMKNIFLNSTLFLASFLITFLFLEMGIRFYIKIQGTKLGINRIEHFARSWPLLQGVEGKKYYFELIPSTKKTLEGFTYQINDQGLRDNKEKFYNDPQAYHILILGASQTFGVGVNYEDTYGSVLEEKLNSHYRTEGRTFQVWNGGVPARHIEQNIGAFEQKYAQLDPDMVILSFAVDVFVRPSWHFKEGILYVPEKGYWFQQLVYRSRLASFIVFRYKNQRYNPYNYYSNYYGRVDKRWDYGMGQIKRINALCEEKGIKLVVLDLTTPFWEGRLKKEDWIEYSYNLKTEELCKKEGAAYINTIFAFEGLEARSLWAIPDYDCHYNPKATQLVAESVFKTLLAINPTKG